MADRRPDYHQQNPKLDQGDEDQGGEQMDAEQSPKSSEGGLGTEPPQGGYDEGSVPAAHAVQAAPPVRRELNYEGFVYAIGWRRPELLEQANVVPEVGEVVQREVQEELRQAAQQDVPSEQQTKAQQELYEEAKEIAQKELLEKVKERMTDRVKLVVGEAPQQEAAVEAGQEFDNYENRQIGQRQRANTLDNKQRMLELRELAKQRKISLQQKKAEAEAAKEQEQQYQDDRNVQSTSGQSSSAQPPSEQPSSEQSSSKQSSSAQSSSTQESSPTQESSRSSNVISDEAGRESERRSILYNLHRFEAMNRSMENVSVSAHRHEEPAHFPIRQRLERRCKSARRPGRGKECAFASFVTYDEYNPEPVRALSPIIEETSSAPSSPDTQAASSPDQQAASSPEQQSASSPDQQPTSSSDQQAVKKRKDEKKSGEVVAVPTSSSADEQAERKKAFSPPSASLPSTSPSQRNTRDQRDHQQSSEAGNSEAQRSRTQQQKKDDEDKHDAPEI